MPNKQENEPVNASKSDQVNTSVTTGTLVDVSAGDTESKTKTNSSASRSKKTSKKS